MTEESDSVCISKGPCPECPSSDGFTTWSDGHKYCFVCNHYEHPEGDQPITYKKKKAKSMRDYNPIKGETRGFIKEIGISEETCRKLGIEVVEYSIEWKGQKLPRKKCLSFLYRELDGSPFGQKIRYAKPDEETDKTFVFPNAGGTPPLWLMDKWTSGYSGSIVIFEGEKDAASYYQVTGGKYPVVSIPTGAQASSKILKKHYEFLDRFDKIVLIFDGDGPGRERVKEAARCLPPGKVYIGEVQGYKDANEALKDGNAKAITQAFWNADMFKPDGIVMSSEFIAGTRKRRLLQEASKLTYPYEGLTEVTRGLFEGDLITLLAGSGCGKSTIARAIAYHLHMNHQAPVGMLMLEEDKDDTIDGLIGMHIGRNILMDPNLCTDEQHQEAVEAMGLDDPEKAIAIYDHFGSTDIDGICDKIRFMTRALGRKVIVLDHISIVVSGLDTGDERKLIDMAMTKLKTLAQSEKCILIVVTHLKRPSGDKGHEDGAEVKAGQARGSHSIIQLSNVCIGVQKDPENPTADTVDLYVLKNRKSGARKFAGRLNFDRLTGLLTEDKQHTPYNTGFKNQEKREVPDGDGIDEGDDPLNI